MAFGSNAVFRNSCCFSATHAVGSCHPEVVFDVEGNTVSLSQILVENNCIPQFGMTNIRQGKLNSHRSKTRYAFKFDGLFCHIICKNTSSFCFSAMNDPVLSANPSERFYALIQVRSGVGSRYLNPNPRLTFWHHWMAKPNHVNSLIQ